MAKRRGTSNPVRAMVVRYMSLHATFVPMGFIQENLTKLYRQILSEYACSSASLIRKFASTISVEMVKAYHREGYCDESQLTDGVSRLQNLKKGNADICGSVQDGFNLRCPSYCTFLYHGERSRCKAGYSVRSIGGMSFHRSRCGMDKELNSRNPIV
jgi:hypothetical protein